MKPEDTHYFILLGAELPEDTYYVRAKPGELKRLDRVEVDRIRLLTGRQLTTASNDPLRAHEWIGQKLLDHIAALEAEILQLRSRYEATS